MKLAVIISPNWKDYAEKYLASCVASVCAQTTQNFKLFLIDNESTEKSLSFLKTNAPEAEIIALKTNAGFAGGNNAALKKAMEQGFEYAFLINMDARAEKDCMERLMEMAEVHSEAAAIQPRIMLWPEKELINSLGNATHFLGFGYCDKYRQSFNPELDNVIRDISYASGAGVLFRLSVLKEVGLFDEKFWMYNEDQDICLRLWLNNQRTIIAPSAVVYHEYEFSRSIAKYYWMDRNRLLVLLKHCRLATLFFLLPALLIMEGGTMLFSLKTGWFKEKIKVWGYFVWPLNWVYISKARRETQALRRVSDRQFTRLFSGRIWYQEVDDIKLRLINPVFSLYWKLVRLIMFW